MRLVATSEQLALQEMLRRLLEKNCPTSLVRELKAPGRESAAIGLWTALRDAGVLGMAVNERYGGGSGSLYELGLVFAEAGRALCPTLVYSTLIFGVALDRLGTAEQKVRYLPALTRGDLRASTALWNPSDAGDVRPSFTARRIDGGWSLTGSQPYLQNAEQADVVLLSARTVPAPGSSEPARTIAALVVPGDPFWRAEPRIGIAGDPVSSVALDDYRVLDDAVVDLGDNGQDAIGLRWVAQAATALQCMEMVGGTAAVIDQTVAYVKTREQFGRPIASFQAVQHHVANMRIALDAARLSAAQATWRISRGELATRVVAIAAMQCSEAYRWATLTCHQLQGGMGYIRDTDLHLWSERAKVTELLGGNADVAAGWLQRELGLIG
jgi:alkylation response protein AidB-like acyl-CoA dehydrogenase